MGINTVDGDFKFTGDVDIEGDLTGGITDVVTTGEALLAGDLVNLHNDGAYKVRKADATDGSKPAHGYVTQGYGLGVAAVVFFSGINKFSSGLNAGQVQYLFSPGLTSPNRPTAAGNVVQVVGVSLSATEFVFDPQGFQDDFCLTIPAVDSDTFITVGDGVKGTVVPVSFAGANLIAAEASVYVAGLTSGTTDIRIRRARAGGDADMLSTPITLSVGEYTISDGVIDGANDDINPGDIIFVDRDAINGTAPKGLWVKLRFRRP